MTIEFALFDFDSHYYEPLDAFTRHAPRGLGSRVECSGWSRRVACVCSSAAS